MADSCPMGGDHDWQTVEYIYQDEDDPGQTFVVRATECSKCGTTK